jgi:hypothetical protein
MYHVAFLTGDALDAILDGRKTREIRLSERPAPFTSVVKGDGLFLERRRRRDRGVGVGHRG